MARDLGFMHGVALVIADLVRGGDDDIAVNKLADFGFKVEDFRKAQVESYDMRVISKLYRDNPTLK